MASSRTPSPSKAKSPCAQKLDLEFFKIFIKRKKPMPADLRALLDKLEEPRLTASPNAKMVERKQPSALEMSEANSIDWLKRELLLPPAREGGETYVETALNQNLKRYWLPQATNAKWGKLVQARPDWSIGYIFEKTADVSYPPLPSPFTEEDDLYLRKASTGADHHFPWFTCQWKSGKPGAEGHPEAQIQGARDGALLVNYMRWFYDTAGVNATAAQTCHFSATCDVSNLHVYVHWANVTTGADGTASVNFEMDRVGGSIDLEDSESISNFRRFLRNLQDYAVGPKLAELKEHVPALTRVLSNDLSVIPNVSPSSASGSAPASVLGSDASAMDQRFQFKPPLTPNSSAGMEPPSLKRARTEGDGEIG
jgi:hypothetical protein